MDCIPLETMYHVAQFLNLPCLYQFLQVNHAFYEIVEQLWRNRLEATFPKCQIQNNQSAKENYKMLRQSCEGQFQVHGLQFQEFRRPIKYGYNMTLQDRHQNIDPSIISILRRYSFSTNSLYILNRNCNSRINTDVTVCDIFGIQYGCYVCFFQLWTQVEVSLCFTTICLGKIHGKKGITGVWNDSYKQFGLFTMVERSLDGFDELLPQNRVSGQEATERNSIKLDPKKLYRLDFVQSFSGLDESQLKKLNFKHGFMVGNDMFWISRWKKDNFFKVFVCMYDSNYMAMMIISENTAKCGILFEIEKTTEESVDANSSKDDPRIRAIESAKGICFTKEGIQGVVLLKSV